jgi:hypothetical protein
MFGKRLTLPTRGRFRLGSPGAIVMLALVCLGMTPPAARADFMLGEGTDELKFYPNKKSLMSTATGSSFFGSVGKNNSDNDVGVTSIGAVDISNGFGEIDPAKGSATFQSLTLKPTSPIRFSDVDFRGQLPTAGTVTVDVTDQNDVTTHFSFTFDKQDADFKIEDIVGVNGETIKSVTISSSVGFESMKQIEFSPVPEPSSLILFGLGLVGVSGYRLRRKQSQS